MTKYLLTIFLALLMLNHTAAQATWGTESMKKLEAELVKKYGEGQRMRLQRGMQQVLTFWRDEDGDAAVFESFVRKHFAGDQATLDEMFNRFQALLESLNGHMNEITIDFRRQADLDIGHIYPFDEIFAAYSPGAHVADDFFKNKLAFIVLLNFPLTTLEQRLAEGETWTRRQWAEARLAARFSKRVPAEVNQEVNRAASEANQYIADYNIWMHNLVDDRGKRLFPPKMRLLAHWNLRDEIKASYADEKEGLAKQKMIRQVMERIVTQTIPSVVVNNPHVDWNPFTNSVKRTTLRDPGASPPPDMKVTTDREPDTRYEKLLNTFRASQKVDPYSPTAPTLIARRFDENRELPEARVREMFEKVLTAPVVSEVAELIEQRLGRPLEPFDIWYSGFRPRSAYSEQDLDRTVAGRYPNAEAFRNDIPNILQSLGFTEERARFLTDHILVEPARGSGHAWGPAMRSAKARLRTRIEKDGMNYKGYNIAIHELGHNVEQIISLYDIDYTLLEGVPNTAFTEALAFVFQGRDLEILGLATPDERSIAMKTLDDFWGTYEIAGVALVDMDVWQWMYDNPNATPAELREATVRIAKQIWDRYYSGIFRHKGVVLLGIYSHMIQSFLYLPDYPIGHMIAFQINDKMRRAGSVGEEFERIARLGNIAPDLWMKKATGSPVGPEALILATERAVKLLQE